MRGIDGPTNRYIQRIARNIGYFDKILNAKPTTHILTEMGLDYVVLDNLELNCDGIATIFSVETAEIANTDRWGSSGGFTDCGENMYVVDWAVTNLDTEQYEHRTFIFSDLPDQDSITTAHQLNKIRCVIGQSHTEQHYTCECCGSRVHWTQLETPEWMGEETLDQRITMMKQKVCGCEATRVLSPSVKPPNGKQADSNAVTTQQTD
jgi:hypothetical protein